MTLPSDGTVYRFGLYALSGLAVFTLVRVALLRYGVSGWQSIVIPLVVMLIVLEILTTVGWLGDPPLSDGTGNG